MPFTRDYISTVFTQYSTCQNGSHHVLTLRACVQMNRESSRSHLIMSMIIEATNLQTQNVTKGKLSFVDLAGSERCSPAYLNANAMFAFVRY